LEALETPLVRQFDLLSRAPGAVARLRELILELAVRGKLVPQDRNEESASVLLQRIGAVKAATAQKLKGRAPAAAPADDQREEPFELPRGWIWTTLSDIGLISPRHVADDFIGASFVQMR
jgi:type I restriction enzyme S subunit